MPNTKIQVVVEAIDKTKKVFNEVENNLKKMNAKMKNAEKASLAFAGGLTVLAGGVGLLAKQAIEAAGQYEQSHIAFSTMLGSAEEATELLSELADFARKTPFELVGIESSAKQLLAMGIEADNLLPTLKSLGDVSAGLSVPISRLALNFGQVKTQGKLTGRELRDFSIAGVPLIDALVDVLNEMGGTTKVVGETSKEATKEIKKFTKENESAEKKVRTLTLSLKKQKNRMDEMVKKEREGTAAFKNLELAIADTEARLSVSKDTIIETSHKLKGLGSISEGVSTSIKVTKEDIADMVSEGEIGFDLVEKAFQRMTEEGGKFEDLMEKQSTTLVGMIENLKDAWNLFLREEGQALLEWAKKFVEGAIFIVDNVLPQWIGKIKEIITFLKEHKEVLIILVSTIIGGLTPAIYGAVVAFATLALTLAPFLIGGAIIGGLVAGMLWLKENWEQVSEFFVQTWEGLKIVASETIDPIIEKFGEFLDIINEIKLTFNIMKKGFSDLKLPNLLGGFEFPNFQSSGISSTMPQSILTQPALATAGIEGGTKVINNNWNFEGAFIGNKEQFKKEITEHIDRESELKSLAGQ